MNSYQHFLQNKVRLAANTGFEPKDTNAKLFPFQRDACEWAIRRGRAALFLDTGLGKTAIQLEWARQVAGKGGAVLILAPLGVVGQTCREAETFGIPNVFAVRESEGPIAPGTIHVSNYDSLHKLDTSLYSGIVLDESSILKNFMGKTKTRLIEAFRETPYRLCCTATPAPNDHMEIGNHCDFLGVMPANEMLSRWFINDTMNFGCYRLKGHALKDFWEWVASWALAATKPSDLGDYSDDGYILPELRVHRINVEVDYTKGKEDGELLRSVTVSATSIHKEMRLTCKDRCAKAVEIVSENPFEPALIWCHTNQESDSLADLIGVDAAVVEGSQKIDVKEREMDAFATGKKPHMVTKPSICGAGLNWQHCHRVIFVGLSYSYEELYQAIRRSWRFGQKHPVDVYLIAAETEQNILKVIDDKTVEHEEMKANMIAAQNKLKQSDPVELKFSFEHEIKRGRNWEMHLGDSCEVIGTIPDNSMDFCIHSPPFSNLYIYSDSLRDMGNCANDTEFFEHYNFLIPEIFRITKPGRLCAVHCKQLVDYRGRDGRSGWRDFRGDIIRAYEKGGWKYHSEVVIWKDPVIEMQRTKCQRLLYKQLRTDASFTGIGMPEYLCIFRKWGTKEDEEKYGPIRHSNPNKSTVEESDEEKPAGGQFSSVKPPKQDQNPIALDDWQQIASPHWDTSGELHYPVWRTIRQTNVLNGKLARENEDEKHICPLQLDVIQRAVLLWTNPGERVFSPFGGIGSEGYQSLLMNRKFTGIELKPEYFKNACEYLASAETQPVDMFQNH